MNILFDTHTHSTISDGGDSPEEMLCSAAEKGFSILTLTDHFDLHEHSPKHLSPFDGAGQESSYKTLCELKTLSEKDERYKNITFLKGIEIAQAHQYRDVAESWLDNHEYDFILGSCHIIRSGDHMDFYNMDYNMDYKKNEPNKLMKQYFGELIELCEWCISPSPTKEKRFDSLAHLTYPMRYMPKGSVNLDDHKALINSLFEVMVKGEIALEINTGHAEMLCPDLPQLIEYKRLGGKLITIGSDSHNKNTLAQRIDKGIEIAKAAGFRECVYYKGRKPYTIAL